MVQQDLRDQQAQRALQAQQVQMVQQVLQDRRAQRVLQAQLVLRVQPVQQVLRVQKVQDWKRTADAILLRLRILKL